MSWLADRESRLVGVDALYNERALRIASVRQPMIRISNGSPGPVPAGDASGDDPQGAHASNAMPQFRAASARPAAPRSVSDDPAGMLARQPGLLLPSNTQATVFDLRLRRGVALVATDVSSSLKASAHGGEAGGTQRLLLPKDVSDAVMRLDHPGAPMQYWHLRVAAEGQVRWTPFGAGTYDPARFERGVLDLHDILSATDRARGAPGERETVYGTTDLGSLLDRAMSKAPDGEAIRTAVRRRPEAVYLLAQVLSHGPSFRALDVGADGALSVRDLVSWYQVHGSMPAMVTQPRR